MDDMARGRKNQEQEVEDTHTEVDPGHSHGLNDPAHSHGVNDPGNGDAVDTKTTKSIVPSKYAGKYKDKSGNALSMFIEEQCKDGDAFSFSKFFDLCKANGITEEQIAPYTGLLDADSKVNGLAGRARMTLANRLRPIGRKKGHLVGLDGAEHEVHVPPAPARTQAQKDATEKLVGETHHEESAEAA